MELGFIGTQMEISSLYANLDERPQIRWGEKLPYDDVILTEYEKRAEEMLQKKETEELGKAMKHYRKTGFLRQTIGWLLERSISENFPEEKEAVDITRRVLNQKGLLGEAVEFLRKIVIEQLSVNKDNPTESLLMIKQNWPKLYRAVLRSTELPDMMLNDPMFRRWNLLDLLVEEWLKFNKDHWLLETIIKRWLENFCRDYNEEKGKVLWRIAEIAPCGYGIGEMLSLKLMALWNTSMTEKEKMELLKLLKKADKLDVDLLKTFLENERSHFSSSAVFKELLALQGKSRPQKIETLDRALEWHKADYHCKDEKRLLSQQSCYAFILGSILELLRQGEVIVQEDRMYETHYFLFVTAYEDELDMLHKKGFFTKGCIRELLNLGRERDPMIVRRMPLLLQWYYC